MSYYSYIREPKPQERYRSRWSLAESTAGASEFRARMARLSRRLYLPHPWPHNADHTIEAWENPHIPAGYTYLAQFVAHDTVNSTVPTSAIGRSLRKLQNGRLTALELETLYGQGFDGCLTAIADSDRVGNKPSKLRLGRIRIGSTVGENCPLRDIPRARSTHTTVDSAGLQNVLIADDRNDNSAFIAQMTMLFTLFHNLIVDLITSDARSTPEQDGQSYFATLFESARDINIKTYKRIVRDDLMRKLLHPSVYTEFSPEKPRFLDRRPAAGITAEYVHALRFGHAMVRPHYRVNDLHKRREELIDVLLTTSRARPWRMPLDESWAIQWSNFFHISRRQPNHSRRISPSFSPDLLSDLVFDRIDDTQSAGLAYRDMLGSYAQTVWGVTPLIAEIESVAPAMIRASRLLADTEYRTARLRDWLAERIEATGLTEQDIEDLSRDPPLLVFVLFEAAHEMRGEKLGILGSLVIGEPIFKALNDGLARQVTCPLQRRAGEGNFHDPTQEISCMAALIEFIRSAAKLDESIIAFV